MTAENFQQRGTNLIGLWAWGVLAILTLMMVACGGSDNSASSSGPGSTPTPDSTVRPDGREPASASMGGATAVASDPAYEDWAAAVCTVLDSSLLQPETVSVSAEDLAAFFRGASTNSQDVASKLKDIEAAPGTEAFMQTAESAFEDLVPILSETADLLDAAAPGTPQSSGADDTAGLREILDPQETKINEALGRIRTAASNLPTEAVQTMLNQLSCGAIRRQ